MNDHGSTVRKRTGTVRGRGRGHQYNSCSSVIFAKSVYFRTLHNDHDHNHGEKEHALKVCAIASPHKAVAQNVSLRMSWCIILSDGAARIHISSTHRFSNSTQGSHASGH